MATNQSLEMIAGTLYPKSMKNLQQLLMDAEACANSYGKKTLFGNDKFRPKYEKFLSTLLKCGFSLAEDNHIRDPANMEEVVTAVDKAMRLLSDVYSNWPLSFQFWEIFKSGKLENSR